MNKNKGRIMMQFIMHASNHKFTMVVLSVLSLAAIPSDLYQQRFKTFGESGQVFAHTQANVSNPAVDVQLKIQINEQRYCRSTTANYNVLQIALSVDFINS